MKIDFLIDAAILAVMLFVCVLVLFVLPQPTHQVINCSLAEISPDFTPDMRKECRLLRATKL
jgi:hypothetical protein